MRGFGLGIPVIDLIEGHDRDQIVVCAAQCQFFANGRQFFGISRQGDGKREEGSICEAHFLAARGHNPLCP